MGEAAAFFKAYQFIPSERATDLGHSKLLRISAAPILGNMLQIPHRTQKDSGRTLLVGRRGAESEHTSNAAEFDAGGLNLCHRSSDVRYGEASRNGEGSAGSRGGGRHREQNDWRHGEGVIGDAGRTRERDRNGGRRGGTRKIALAGYR